MTVKHETPGIGEAGYEACEAAANSGWREDVYDLSQGGTIRDLELLAGALRDAGDAGNTERVDQTILALLEKKIYRKIMAQHRRRSRPLAGAAA